RQHPFGVQQYVVVPESQNPKALPLQPGIAQGVMLTFAMLATIGLDDQACAEVHEVEHIRPQRLLAAKLLSTQPMGAQVVPEHALGVGHSCAAADGRSVSDPWHPCLA